MCMCLSVCLSVCMCFLGEDAGRKDGGGRKGLSIYELDCDMGFNVFLYRSTTYSLVVHRSIVKTPSFINRSELHFYLDDR